MLSVWRPFALSRRGSSVYERVMSFSEPGRCTRAIWARRGPSHYMPARWFRRARIGSNGIWCPTSPGQP